tara:strand:- start:38 stop:244 length:207 start_codon:yes stop_codon:yes gene_type:complete
MTKDIDYRDVLNWHGSDHGVEELAKVIADVVNGDYWLEWLRNDIITYKEDSKETTQIISEQEGEIDDE